MNSEHREPPSDHFAGGRRPSSELWEPWEIAEEDTQPLINEQPARTGVIHHAPQERPLAETLPGGQASLHEAAIDPQPSYREHVTGSLAAHPAEAPLFQPAYLPYGRDLSRPQMYPQQVQTYAPQPVYQQYPGYPPGYAPYALPNKTMNASQLFNVDIVIALFICVGIFGGSFGLYHSIRSLAKKPSAAFSLPWFWIFLVLYVVVAIIPGDRR